MTACTVELVDQVLVDEQLAVRRPKIAPEVPRLPGNCPEVRLPEDVPEVSLRGRCPEVRTGPSSENVGTCPPLRHPSEKPGRRPEIPDAGRELASRTGKRWTLREDDLLEARWGRVSVAALAELLGRREGAILARVRRLRLQGPERYSLARAGRVLGWSRTAIRRAARRAGVPLRRRPAIGPAQARPAALTWGQVGRLAGELLGI